MAKPAASRTKPKAKAPAKPARPVKSVIVLYLVFAVVFVVVAFYTALHLVFYGFSGEPIGIDLGAALLLPLVWAIGLLRTVKLRATPVAALTWGYSVIGVLVVALVVDTVRFQPILGS
jgi:hypothetical protein